MWMDNWVLNVPREYWNGPILFRFFETMRPVVVLSSSNKANRESFEERCQESDVPILQRKGGGGTVVLGPGCLILTLAFYAKELYANQKYFEKVNQLWIEALDTCGVSGLCTRGISDIAKGDQKIAGTSVFRRRHLFVYQGSLLVKPDFQAIEKLLQHPSREPDYRQGRSHRAFLTSLEELGCQLSVEEVTKRCDDYFQKHAKKVLKECLLSDFLS
jgi:lipoate---protein ligase